MVRVWPWLLLAACSSDGSLEIRVHIPEGMAVSQVELYVGYHDDHVEQVRPARGKLDEAVWWKRDRSELDIRTVKAGQDLVLFPFEVGGPRGDSLSAFVVVGYNSESQPVSVATQLLWTDIPDDEIHVYDLALGPFQSIPGDPSKPEPGLQIWGPVGDEHACVQVDNIRALQEYRDDNGDPVKSGMIVRRNDQDCDGYEVDDVMKPDCVENEYMTQRPLSRDELVCSSPKMFSPTQTGCVMGGEACVDGSGMVPGVCARSSYCTATGLCACDTPASCELGTTPIQTPMIECPLAVNPSDQTQLCPTYVDRLDLANLFAIPGLTCDASLDKMSGAKLRPRDFSSGFVNPYPLAPNTMMEIVPSAGHACAFDLIATGPLPAVGSALAAEVPAWFSTPLTGPGSNHGLVYPIVFRVDSAASCPDGVTTIALCKIVQGATRVTDPGLETCLTSELEPGTFVGD